MNIKKLLASGLLVTTLTVSAALAQAADNCQRFSHRIAKQNRDIGSLNFQIEDLASKRLSKFYVTANRQSNLRNVRSSLSRQENDLTSLRYDFRNGPVLIEENLNRISANKMQIPREVAKAHTLEVKYDSISNSIFKKLKKWNKQVRKIEALKHEITSCKNKIASLKDIARNFSEYEFTAEGRVIRAEDRLQQELNIVPTIGQLNQRLNRMQRQIDDMKIDRNNHKLTLDLLNEELRMCQAQ